MRVETVSSGDGNYSLLNHRLNNKSHSFLLCNSCFWCASTYLHNDNRCMEVKQCPLCTNRTIESMPISNNEAYKFDYSAKRGISLELIKTDDHKPASMDKKKDL